MKSTKDLRNFLIEQMVKTAAGEVDIAAVKNVTNIAQQIYNTVNIELKVAIARKKYGDDLSLEKVTFDDG